MNSEDLYLRKQLISQKLAWRLREIGVPQRSFFIWEREGEHWRAVSRSRSNSDDDVVCSAFMASELGCLLPSEVAVYKRRTGGHWECAAVAPDDSDSSVPQPVRANTMPDALAKMLIQIVEQRSVQLSWMVTLHSEQ